MALSPEKNWVEVLQNLPSYKEYDKFDKVDIKNENSNHCNNLGSKDEGDKTFCKQVVQNLNQLSVLKDDQKIKNSCYYFQHWFFDNIAKKYYNGSKKGTNYTVAEKLFNIVSTLTAAPSKIVPCKCYESGSPDDWKKEKYLHDYFENHQDIKCSNSGKDRCEKYIQYVTYINNLYQEKEYKCCDGDELDEEGFCESYFKCENMYNPKNLLIKLQKELQSLGKEPEVPREGGAVEAGRATVSGGEEREKKTHEDEVSAETTGKESKEKLVAGEVPKEKGADSPAQSSQEKNVAVKPTVPESVGSKSGGLETRNEKAALAKTVGEKPPAEKSVAAEPAAIKPPVAGPVVAESERAKPEAAKPVAVKPKETVSEEGSAEREEAEGEANEEESSEGLTVEEVTTEDLVTEMTSTMQNEEALGPQPIESAEQGVPAISSHNTEPASNALPLRIADSPNTLGTAHEGLDSNFFRNVIMAIAVLGTIFFLFYYNRSSRLESSLRKRKKKKRKIFEHNYYEEYEKELEMYGSEETFLDSETDRLYLNYHPDQDSYY
ncbi:PIR protein [Plasmodium vivax]|nr:PIR protein [Plasmodium vivax]